MIRDWKTGRPTTAVSGPIGDPHMASNAYMRIFLVLEMAALGSLTHSELIRWSRTPFSIADLAKAEIIRREVF